VPTVSANRKTDAKRGNKSETGDDTNDYCGFHDPGCDCSGQPVRGIVKTIGEIKQRNG